MKDLLDVVCELADARLRLLDFGQGAERARLLAVVPPVLLDDLLVDLGERPVARVLLGSPAGGLDSLPCEPLDLRDQIRIELGRNCLAPPDLLQEESFLANMKWRLDLSIINKL